jgi:uncharacterized repeat protein (TIGR03803 family)
LIMTNIKNHTNFRTKACFATLGALIGAAALGTGSAWGQPSETVLYSFCQGCADGSFPEAGLIATADGDLYGTASGGGSANVGVAFMLPETGGIRLLHQFQGGNMDGASPEAPLFRDKSGNLFATSTRGGGTGCGTVFERSAAGTYRLRHAFNGTDGSTLLRALLPTAPVIFTGRARVAAPTVEAQSSGWRRAAS